MSNELNELYEDAKNYDVDGSVLTLMVFGNRGLKELRTGIEDGWIKADEEIWDEYLKRDWIFQRK